MTDFPKNNENSTKARKKAMVEAMKGQLGIVSLACQEVGISRQTHYKWLKEDKNYAELIAEVPETTLDFAEHALHKLINAGNVTAIIFFLKTQAKKRGYIEINSNQFNYLNQAGSTNIISGEEASRAMEALKEYEQRIATKT